MKVELRHMVEVDNYNLEKEVTLYLPLIHMWDWWWPHFLPENTEIQNKPRMTIRQSQFGRTTNLGFMWEEANGLSHQLMFYAFPDERVEYALRSMFPPSWPIVLRDSRSEDIYHSSY